MFIAKNKKNTGNYKQSNKNSLRFFDPEIINILGFIFKYILLHISFLLIALNMVYMNIPQAYSFPRKLLFDIIPPLMKKITN